MADNLMVKEVCLKIEKNIIYIHKVNLYIYIERERERERERDNTLLVNKIVLLIQK